MLSVLTLYSPSFRVYHFHPLFAILEKKHYLNWLIFFLFLSLFPFGLFVSKPDSPYLLYSLTVIGLVLTLFQAIPSMLDDLKKSWRLGLQLLTVILLVVSLGLNLFFWTNHQPLSHSTTPPTQTTNKPPLHPTTSPTQDPNSLPPYIPGSGRRIINKDPLVANNLDWITGQNISGPQYPGDCEFTSNGFLFTGYKHFYGCQEHKFDNLTDFVLEAKITLQPGNIGGFLFRNADNQGDGYGIEIDPNGHYDIGLPSHQGQLASGSSIPPGLASYVVDVEVLGNQITLYVNGTKIASSTDPHSTYSSGRFGLFVSGRGDPGYSLENTATFSNLTVWSILG